MSGRFLFAHDFLVALGPGLAITHFIEQERCHP